MRDFLLRLEIDRWAIGLGLFAGLLFAVSTRASVSSARTEKPLAADSAVRSEDLLPVWVKAGRILQISGEVGKTAQVGSEIMVQNAASSLADILAEHSVLHIKSLGQGAQATSSFRGTSSSHTQVLWNGINLNSATLGNFDFSLIPGFFVDELTLYTGAAQNRGGSSIGGSVQLNNKWTPLPVDGYRIQVRGEWGSWATQTYGLALQYRKAKWSSHTRVYLQSSENNFRYENRVLTMNPFEETRKQAAFGQMGILQELYYPINATDVLSLCVWGQWDRRELPQPITSFNTLDETQASYHLRTLVKYATERRSWKSIWSLAYLHDRLDYEKKTYNNFGNVSAHNRAEAWVLSWDNAYRFHARVEGRWSFQVREDQVKSASYAGQYAQRSDFQLQGGFTWSITPRWTTDVSGMAEFMKSSRQKGQVAPNLSAVLRYDWVPKLLQLHYGQSLNGRFPTLNDWYWEPGGNPDLKPERAWSQEWGLALNPYADPSERLNRKLKWKTEIKVYAMEVKDWIMWVPSGAGYLWEPRNFARVRARGTEWAGHLFYSAAHSEHRLTAQYAYASSVDRTREQSGSYNRQLPYIPLNKWNLRYAVDGDLLGWGVKKLAGVRWNLAYGVYFTDARFTSADESYATPAYCLHDALLGTQWKATNTSVPYELKLQLKVSNLWDAYYESTQYYPMPQRTFSFSLTMNL